MNAYQMKDLITFVQKENELLIAWLNDAEENVIQGEEQLAGLNKSIVGFNLKKKTDPDEKLIKYLSQKKIK